MPTHVVYLSEGFRPVLRLVPIDPAEAEQAVSWVPRSPSTILADALVMLAALVVGDRQTIAVLDSTRSGKVTSGPLELANSAGEALVAACAGLLNASLVVAVCEGSSVADQLRILADVAGEVEVLSSSYLSCGPLGQRTTRGSLGKYAH